MNEMSKKEAIEVIQSCIGFNKSIMPYSDEMLAFGLAIEALQIQSPTKPRITNHIYKHKGEEIKVKFKHCPRCFPNVGYFNSLLDKDHDFCYRCGQAIDWSEVENG